MGPTLFNVFVKDLFIHVTQTKLNASVGDHQIYHSNVDPLVSDRYICNDVEKANQWYSQNGMIVNAKKDQALIIDQTERKFSFPVKCELDIFVMATDIRLNFDKHISAVCNKINNQFNVMLRFSNIISKVTMLKMYNVFILQHFYYCFSVWHFCRTRNSEKLEAVN